MDGDYVYLKKLKRCVKIIKENELWGYKSYLVLDMTTNSVLTVNEDEIDENIVHNIYELKYILNASKIKNEIHSGILSPIGDNIIPLPHQIYALKRALSNNRVRYLLSDEVGLGKTIEAGLILKELKLRGLVKRILILSPKGLINQWQEELLDKFKEKFNILLPQDFESLKRAHGEGNIWLKFNQVITSHDSVKPIDYRNGLSKEDIDILNTERFINLISAGWDIVIIDEAHRLAGSSTDVARYRLGKSLSFSTPYLLLLSATPHQGKSDSFLRLIRFLDEDAFPNEKAVTRQLVAPYVIRTEKREAIDFNGNKIFKNRYTKIINIKWNKEHEMQKILYEKVTDYVAKGYNRAVKERKSYIGFLMVLMQRMVSSSTRAIREYIERRIDILNSQLFNSFGISTDEFYEEDGEKLLEDLIYSTSLDIKKEIKELNEILSIAKLCELQYLDVKIETLLDIIFKSHTKEDNKFLVFTEFIGTQEYIYNILTQKGYKAVKLNGSMNMDERKEVLKVFKNEADVLISTDAGGEGLNLQFCHIVINYDMPWNPMKIEQRIGRVDRIGQDKDVLAFNFILEDTIENRVRNVLEEKLSIIFKEFGIDKSSDVLDSVEAGVDFTEVYIKSIANPKYLDLYASNIEEKIKEKTAAVNKARELLKDDKDINLNVLKDITSESLLDYVKGMYVNYQLSIGNAIRLDEGYYDLKDDKIKGLLNISEFPIKKSIPKVNFKNKLNEKGFWSLWEININEDERFCSIFPIFINEHNDYKPATAKALYDIFLKEDIEFIGNFYGDIYFDNIKNTAQYIAYNYFSSMKDNYLEEIDREMEKYKLSFEFKKEAAERIGLENVRNYKLRQLENEEKDILKKLDDKRHITPILKLLYMVYVE